MKLEVAKPFAPILNFSKRFVLIKGGRASGKSTFSAQMSVILSMSFPERDIVVTRDSYSDLQNSAFAEFQKFIGDNGLEHEFEFRTAPLHIKNIRTNSHIYFLGIGGSDIHRTHSFKPHHKLIAIVFEELQQTRDQESLEQAHATFRRHLDTDKGMFIHLFNPPSQNSHWVNIYWNVRSRDNDWLCIYSDYTDIIRYLNDVDLKEIIKMKVYDPIRYEWMYLGKTGGGFGSIYPQFKRDRHFLSYKSILEKFGMTENLNITEDTKAMRFGQRIQALIIGGDGAVTHDATVFVPMALMANGQMVCLEPFYYDPQKSGQKGSMELLPSITRWLSFLDKRYQLISQQKPIIFSIDSASTELIRVLRYSLDPSIEIYEYGKQTILDMVGVVQDALARNMIYIMDFNGYKNWTTNDFVSETHPLVVAIENLIWNEKQTGYDASVPNDASDAFTYAVNQVFRNPHALRILQLYNENRQTFYDVL